MLGRMELSPKQLVYFTVRLTLEVLGCIRTTKSNDTATLLGVLVHVLDFVLVPLPLGRYFFA
jgi:hypothetical protein